MRQLVFVVMLVGMLGVTIWATWDRGMLDAGDELMSFPWFIATLVDAYFAFIAFYLCAVMPLTRTMVGRLAWLIGILCLGSMAIAAFALLHHKQLMTHNASVERARDA